MFFRSRCVAVLCAALLLTDELAVAQQGPRALSLGEALTRSAKQNPELAVLDFEVDAQEGRVRQAGAHPAPEIGVLVENALGSGARTGFDSAETTLSLGYAIERGARARRRDVANAGSFVLGADIQIRRLDVAAETGNGSPLSGRVVEPVARRANAHRK
jgi:outer membrane protein, heavy metal efflux system